MIGDTIQAKKELLKLVEKTKLDAVLRWMKQKENSSMTAEQVITRVSQDLFPTYPAEMGKVLDCFDEVWHRFEYQTAYNDGK